MAKHNRLGFLTLATLLFSPSAFAENLQQSISAYDAIDCKPIIEQQIDHYGIDRSDISKISYYNTMIDGNDRGGDAQNFKSELSFRSCTGNLVFALDSGCYVLRIFTTGSCKNSNLPAK